VCSGSGLIIAVQSAFIIGEHLTRWGYIIIAVPYLIIGMFGKKSKDQEMQEREAAKYKDANGYILMFTTL